ncbi:hypothetical protein EON76_05335 [bacterium]|nr:MAG: hypothetical protein EON76_05335 [bacterium]
MRQARIRQRTSALKTFPAATQGWIANQNLALNTSRNLNGAYLLENYFPTATGMEIRKGSAIYATLGDGTIPVTAIFDYNNGNNRRLFASTATTIYDITTVSSPINYELSTGTEDIVDDFGNQLGELSTGNLSVVTGLAGGDWVTTQFATTGGTYVIAVNGQDPMHLYDGTDWFPIDEDDVYMLTYDAKTADFGESQTLTGGTSGATAFVLHVEPSSPTTGFLYITDVTGTFQNNELITTSTGSATADGTPQPYFTGITGVDTRTLSYVWSYKNTLFFIQKDSQTFWYLPVDQISGAAESFPLGGEFSEGGKLLIGSGWSLDTSGDGGLSEQCIFVTTEGQVAVYQGISPATAATWSKVGTYKIGKPLGPLAWIRAGGDIIFATDIGDIPLSQAINRDVAALAPAAVSYAIETEWNREVASRRTSPWNCVVWPEQQMVLVAPPTVDENPPMTFVANARTGAWSKFTNWDIRCLCVFDGRLFFGSQNGRVVECYVTGMDENVPFTANYVPMFNDFGNPASLKIPLIARARLRGSNEVNAQLDIMSDYMITLPSSPSSNTIDTSSVWGGSVWGAATWGGKRDKRIQQAWTSVGGLGYALAPSLQITSGSLIPLDTEVIDVETTFEISDIVA